MSWDHDKHPPNSRSLSRRRFLGLTGVTAVVTGLASAVRVRRRGKLSGTAEAAPLPVAASGYRSVVTAEVKLKVNGANYAVEVDTRSTLANLLREDLRLTGSHVCCDRGECGACTVLMDGQAVYSCSVQALQANGKEIRTVEGLIQGDKLDPIQAAFIEKDGFQCGYCTAGQMMSIKGLLERNPDPTEGEVRQAVAGNICRCGAYPGIIAAALAAAKAKA